MPLVELYFRHQDAPKFSAQELCTFMEGLFQAQPGIVQVMMIPAKDLAPEQVFMSIRAKGTADRKEKVNELLSALSAWLEQHGVPSGRSRIELFDPPQQGAQRWGPPAAARPACWCGFLKFLRRGVPSPDTVPEPSPSTSKAPLLRAGSELPKQASSKAMGA
mmetsp:Transcript_5920/g.10599  ORF Transcript_5920/g.10599 Transcript_5920/m.10599 type:complete len:162 (+) Transcript_5920:72-557(+)